MERLARLVLVSCALGLAAPGCIIDRSGIDPASSLDAAQPADAGRDAPRLDADRDAPGLDAWEPDAWEPDAWERPDAWEEPDAAVDAFSLFDAWAPDAHVPLPDAHLAPLDAYLAPLDAYLAPPDAYLAPPDAYLAPPDAYLAPPDAYLALPDAYLAPPDARVPADAPVGCVAAETCNAIDDDCDGLVDEGACVTRRGPTDYVCEAHVRAGQAYLVCPLATSWNDARGRCAAFGAGYDLVRLDSAEENGALDGWVSPTDLRTWIGLTDDGTRVTGASEGRFYWVDGAPDTLGLWAPGEPTSQIPATPAGRGENCVELLPSSGLWNDLPCAGASVPIEAFACETRIQPRP